MISQTSVQRNRVRFTSTYRYANQGWRATFFLTSREHSMTQATGSAWEPTPWRAVQGAAGETLAKANVTG
jgi:hypothetical protein